MHAQNSGNNICIRTENIYAPLEIIPLNALINGVLLVSIKGEKGEHRKGKIIDRLHGFSVLRRDRM